MSANKNAKVGFLVQCFDVAFIMVLCFATLLTTISLRGKVLSGSGADQALDHSFKASTVLPVAAIFAIYLWYMLWHSDRELGDLVEHIYGKKPPTGPAKTESSKAKDGR